MKAGILFGSLVVAGVMLGAGMTMQPGDTKPKPAAPPTALSETAAVEKVLDALHDNASRAAESKYFALFAPDAVFLGTDASERWTLEQFRAYAHPIFEKGTGWTYHPKVRHVTIAPCGHVAWFDETLLNESYGECRGSGVLIKNAAGEWKISQYNLTVPIPNDMLKDVAEKIREFEKKPKSPAPK